MTTERIEQIRDSKQKAYDRQFDNYQSTGETKYFTKMNAYEEIVDICNIALQGNEPRRELGALKSQLCRLADQAATLIHKYPEGYFMPLEPADLKEFYSALKEIVTIGEMNGYDNKWR